MYTATTIIGIIITLSTLWMCFEIWKAPLLEQKPDGSWVTIKKEKKFSDLFKKKNKTQ
jgi:hypothetical protein